MLDRLVNVIPPSLSGEANQDSEPSLAVNPEQPDQIVVTAFTPDPLHGRHAPIFVSTDAGKTWSLRNVIPGNGPFGTGDISIGFASKGGTLYAGILSADAPPNDTRLQILRAAKAASTSPMTVLVDRLQVDQPWVVAATVTAGPHQNDDAVYVANNDFAGPPGRTATVDLSLDGEHATAGNGFATRRVERENTAGQDGPPVRVAVHSDGTIYAMHQRWTETSGSTVTMDIVVTRDDTWAAAPDPFTALRDSTDNTVGQRVARGRKLIWNAVMGHERLGADAAVAVDPSDSDVVYIAWGDRPGAGVASPWTIHVRRSDDRGRTWSKDLRAIKRGKNPCLAVDESGRVGLLTQRVTGNGPTQRWETTFEVNTDKLTTAEDATVLHRALTAHPVPTFLPYLGDYARVLSLGRTFYGVFSGSNLPDTTNFPSGVTYQRNVTWDQHTLLDLDGATPVPESIDPFFFAWSAG